MIRLETQTQNTTFPMYSSLEYFMVTMICLSPFFRLSSKFNEMLNTMIEDSQHFISEDKNQVDDEERRVKSFRYDVKTSLYSTF